MKTRIKKKRLKVYCEHVFPYCTIRSDVNWSIGYTILKEHGFWWRMYYKSSQHDTYAKLMIDYTHKLFMEAMFKEQFKL